MVGSNPTQGTMIRKLFNTGDFARGQSKDSRYHPSVAACREVGTFATGQSTVDGFIVVEGDFAVGQRSVRAALPIRDFAEGMRQL
jgi:hypothetical protein